MEPRSGRGNPAAFFALKHFLPVIVARRSNNNIGIGVVGYSDFAIVKPGVDLKSPAHRLNHSAQALDANIDTTFHPGNRWLVHTKAVREFFLRCSDRLTELVQRHFLAEFRFPRLDLCTAYLAEVFGEIVERFPVAH
jgi:hypothetical protein